MSGSDTVSCVLLDLDGTLLDTAKDLHAALNRALADFGFEPVSLAAAKPRVSHGAPGMVRFALGGTEGDADYERVLNRMMEYYDMNLAVHTVLFDGMAEVLDEIERAGLAWGVVTNKRSRFTEPLLKSLNLFYRASCVVSGDTTGNKKPHPEPLLEACRRVGTRPRECLYLGDAAKDILAGRRAGMTPLAAVYGYLSDADDVAAWGASGLLHRPLDLLQWIARSEEGRG